MSAKAFAAVTLVLLNVPTLLFAQARLERTEVIMVDSSKSAGELYRSANRWFIDNFRDANSVIQLRDSLTATIVGKGLGKVTWTFGSGGWGAAKEMWYRFTVEVQARDGRVRMRVYDFSMEGKAVLDSSCCWGECGKPGKAYYTSTEQMCRDIRDTPTRLISSLRDALLRKEDDW